MVRKRFVPKWFTVAVLSFLILSGCATTSTTSKDLYSSQISLHVEISGILIGSAPLRYNLFISDYPQVAGKDPVGANNEFINHSNFPGYRRVGQLNNQGQRLDTVSVTGEKFLRTYDITEFFRAHPAKRYFFAIVKEVDSVFMPIEVWFTEVLPDGRTAETNHVIYDYGFDERKPALEFSIDMF